MQELIEPMNEVERLLVEIPVPVLSDDTRAWHRALLLAAVDDDHEVLTPAAPAPQRVRFPRRRRLAAALAAGIALVTVGGGLAVGQLTKAQPRDPAMVRCYALVTTDYGNEAYFIDTALVTAVAPPGAPAPTTPPPTTASAALDVCGGLWFRGELSLTSPYVPNLPPGGDQPVPHLVACVLPEGYVGVFPGPEGTCVALGLTTSGA